LERRGRVKNKIWKIKKRCRTWDQGQKKNNSTTGKILWQSSQRKKAPLGKKIKWPLSNQNKKKKKNNNTKNKPPWPKHTLSIKVQADLEKVRPLKNEVIEVGKRKKRKKKANRKKKIHANRISIHGVSIVLDKKTGGLNGKKKKQNRRQNDKI